MTSYICQKLLHKDWKFYADDLHEAPKVEGIYAIAYADLEEYDIHYLYVGHSINIHRRLREHKYKNSAIGEFVKKQFRKNDGRNLLIKWVKKKNSRCLEGGYLECIETQLGYQLVFNIKRGNAC